MCIYFWCFWGLNTWICACEAGALLLFGFFFLWLHVHLRIIFPIPMKNDIGVLIEIHYIVSVNHFG
jgi:hypothetical protein